MDKKVSGLVKDVMSKGEKVAPVKSIKLKVKFQKVASKMVDNPTGGKMRVGSRKHQYWEDIKKRGEQDKKYGAGD